MIELDNLEMNVADLEARHLHLVEKIQKEARSSTTMGTMEQW